MRQPPCTDMGTGKGYLHWLISTNARVWVEWEEAGGRHFRVEKAGQECGQTDREWEVGM